MEELDPDNIGYIEVNELPVTKLEFPYTASPTQYLLL